MIDRLPTEIIASELVQYCDKDDAYNLMLTCRTVHRATAEHFDKKYRPACNLINLDNPIFFDYNNIYSYNTWILRKGHNCGTRNYYTIPGAYSPSYKRLLKKTPAKL